MKGSEGIGRVGGLTKDTLTYETVKSYVKRELAPCPDLQQADLPTLITGALTRQVERSLPPGTRVDRHLLDKNFPEVVLSLSRDDAQFTCLLVYHLLYLSLRRRLPKDACDPATPAGERLAELRSQALFDTQSGQKILQGYLLQLKSRVQDSETNYWKFMKKSITNVVIDRLRRKGEWSRFAEGERAVDDWGELGDGENGHVLSAPSILGNAPRHMERRDRRELRRLAVERLLALAEDRRDETDWKIVGQFMKWVQANPDQDTYSQAEFARAAGIPQGTVNSSLKRVRDGLPKSPVKDIDLRLLATTAGG